MRTLATVPLHTHSPSCEASRCVCASAFIRSHAIIENAYGLPSIARIYASPRAASTSLTVQVLVANAPLGAPSSSVMRGGPTLIYVLPIAAPTWLTEEC